MIGMKPIAAPCVPDRRAMPRGILKATTAMPRESTREMIEHQWVATLKTPMRTKKTTSGRSPTTAVRKTFPATAVVDGVKDWANKREVMAAPRVSEWDNGPNYHDI